LTTTRPDTAAAYRGKFTASKLRYFYLKEESDSELGMTGDKSTKQNDKDVISTTVTLI